MYLESVYRTLLESLRIEYFSERKLLKILCQIFSRLDKIGETMVSEVKSREIIKYEFSFPNICLSAQNDKSKSNFDDNDNKSPCEAITMQSLQLRKHKYLSDKHKASFSFHVFITYFNLLTFCGINWGLLSVIWCLGSPFFSFYIYLFLN